MEAKGPRENSVLGVGGRGNSKWNQRARRKREKVGRGVEGGERRVVEETMKRPRDKKKEGEGNGERERDGTTVVKWMRRAKKRREKKRKREWLE